MSSGCEGCKYITRGIGEYPCRKCCGFSLYEPVSSKSEDTVEIMVGDVIQYSDSASDATRFGKILTIYNSIIIPNKLIVEVKRLGESFLNPVGVEIVRIDLQDIVNVYREEKALIRNLNNNDDKEEK